MKNRKKLPYQSIFLKYTSYNPIEYLTSLFDSETWFLYSDNKSELENFKAKIKSPNLKRRKERMGIINKYEETGLLE